MKLFLLIPIFPNTSNHVKLPGLTPQMMARFILPLLMGVSAAQIWRQECRHV